MTSDTQTSVLTAADITALRASCARSLTLHVPVKPREAMAELSAAAGDGVDWDRYGEGVWLSDFEARIAAELGKEAAVFMPTGTMAQAIALRIACDRARAETIAFHPTCHLEIHEARSYAFLGGLRAMTCGPAQGLMTAADFSALADPIGALLVELPQREIGGQLPPWGDLTELCAAARERKTHLHLDGARLWEAAPHYGRSHAEIARLFDSVYVSFYKGLGALAGAALAGDTEFVREARTWQHRYGGRLVTLLPLALSASLGFTRNLPKMAAYRDRAIAIARELETLPGLTIVPNPPADEHVPRLLARFGRGARSERARVRARDRHVRLRQARRERATGCAQVGVHRR